MKIIKQERIKEFTTELDAMLTLDVSDLYLSYPESPEMDLYITCMEMVDGAKLVAFMSPIGDDVKLEGLNQVLRVLAPKKFKNQNDDAPKHRVCVERWTYDEVSK